MLREYTLHGSARKALINIKKIVLVLQTDKVDVIAITGTNFSWTINYNYEKMKLLVKMAQRRK